MEQPELTLQEKLQAKAEAAQAKLDGVKAAAERLPLAETELEAACREQGKVLTAYEKAHQKVADLEAEIRGCKVTLGIRVKASPQKKEAPADGS